MQAINALSTTKAAHLRAKIRLDQIEPIAEQRRIGDIARRLRNISVRTLRACFRSLALILRSPRSGRLGRMRRALAPEAPSPPHPEFIEGRDGLSGLLRVRA